MKPSTTDKVEGKFHEVKGKVKEKAGQLRKILDCKPRALLKRRPARFKGFSVGWRSPSKNSITGQ